MKLLFLQPPMGSWVTWGNHKAINVSHVQLAACIREDAPEVDIQVLDCRAMDYRHEQMLNAIGEIQPDLIYLGDAYQMTETIAIIPHYQHSSKLIKEQYPDIKICAGGFYIAANYESVINTSPHFDYVIAGEPEITFTEFCKELCKSDPDLASIKGLVYRDGNDIVINPYRPLIANLDDLPMPAYDLFPMDKYIGYGSINDYQEIFTARGCPFGCDFCIDWVTMDPRGNKDWQKHRIKSAARVVDEIELLKKEYGIGYIHIFDLNFNPKRKRVEEFVEEMNRRQTGVKYGFLGNAHTFLRDQDLLSDLYKSGFISGIFGLEVADDTELKKLKKGITVDEVKAVTENFRKHGILSVITWMVGFPDDDVRLIKERYATLDSIDPDVMALQMMLPVPGLPMYEELTPYIEEHDFAKWDFHHPVIKTKHLSRDQLGMLAAWANREFYTSKGRIQRILESKVLDPYSVAIFRSYIKSMDEYSKSATS